MGFMAPPSFDPKTPPPVFMTWDRMVRGMVVGGLMTVYVAFGGMLATTWVQVVKAVLLLAGATALFVLAMAEFGFDFNALFARAAEKAGAAGQKHAVPVHRAWSHRGEADRLGSLECHRHLLADPDRFDDALRRKRRCGLVAD